MLNRARTALFGMFSSNREGHHNSLILKTYLMNQRAKILSVEAFLAHVYVLKIGAQSLILGLGMAIAQ